MEKKELNHIPLLGYIDTGNVTEDRRWYIKEQNETRELLNEIVDTLNYLMRDKKANYKMSGFYLDNVKKYERLIESGLDVDNMTLRELGNELGIKHPQTVKNFLSKYKLLKQ